MPTAIERYGRLDVLVNNAGAFALGGIEHTTDEQYETVYATNVVAPASLTRAAVPHLTLTRGCVINLSTVVARAVFPGTSVYVSSKAALNQLTRVLAKELGPLGIGRHQYIVKSVAVDIPTRKSGPDPGVFLCAIDAPCFGRTEHANVHASVVGRRCTEDDEGRARLSCSDSACGCHAERKVLETITVEVPGSVRRRGTKNELVDRNTIQDVAVISVNAIHRKTGGIGTGVAKYYIAVDRGSQGVGIGVPRHHHKIVEAIVIKIANNADALTCLVLWPQSRELHALTWLEIVKVNVRRNTIGRAENQIGRTSARTVDAGRRTNQQIVETIAIHIARTAGQDIGAVNMNAVNAVEIGQTQAIAVGHTHRILDIDLGSARDIACITRHR